MPWACVHLGRRQSSKRKEACPPLTGKVAYAEAPAETPKKTASLDEEGHARTPFCTHRWLGTASSGAHFHPIDVSSMPRETRLSMSLRWRWMVSYWFLSILRLTVSRSPYLFCSSARSNGGNTALLRIGLRAYWDRLPVRVQHGDTYVGLMIYHCDVERFCLG